MYFKMSDQVTTLPEQINFKDCVDVKNPSLKAYLGRVKVGNLEIIEGPIAKRFGAEGLLREWKRHLLPLKESMPSLYDFEIDLAGKVGPLSPMKPLADRQSDIDAYYEDILDLPDAPDLFDEVEDVWCKEFDAIRQLTPMLNLQKVEHQMKKSTNSGAPFFIKRRTFFKKYYMMEPDIHDPKWMAYELGSDLDGFYVYRNAAILGWRGQEGGPEVDDVKQRVVWMFPAALNRLENIVYFPLVKACQSQRLVPAWISNEAVDLSVTKLINTKDPDDPIVCTDFTRFDQHFNHYLQTAARKGLEYVLNGDVELISNWFWSQDDGKVYSWLNDVFPQKYSIPLISEWGKVRSGLHGMASGSGGTNADETLAHRMLQHGVAKSKGQALNKYSMCLGDDGILTYPGIKLEDVLEYYTQFGLEMNESKQYVSNTDCVFLRRWHSSSYRVNDVCVGVYSTCRALGRLLYMERFHTDWSAEFEVYRDLSILENCKWHPLKHEFVDWILTKDKYKLGLEIPGFFDNLETRYEEFKRSQTDAVSYNQENMSEAPGIGSWWIVQYLMSKLH